MSYALTSDSMAWWGYILKDLWKFFAWIVIPGTTISIAEAIVSMAAITVIIYFLKSFSGAMRTTEKARERAHSAKARNGE